MMTASSLTTKTTSQVRNLLYVTRAQLITVPPQQIVETTTTEEEPWNCSTGVFIRCGVGPHGPTYPVRIPHGQLPHSPRRGGRGGCPSVCFSRSGPWLRETWKNVLKIQPELSSLKTDRVTSYSNCFLHRGDEGYPERHATFPNLRRRWRERLKRMSHKPDSWTRPHTAPT